VVLFFVLFAKKVGLCLKNNYQWNFYFGVKKMCESLSETNTAVTLPLQQEEQIYHVFQPIFHLGTEQCYGYEALLRSKSYDPQTLFKLAEKKQQKNDLDLLSIKKSIHTFSQSLKGNESLLFLNIFPSTLISPGSSFLYDFIKENPVTAHDRIVIEVNESEVVDDLNKFKETTQALKKAGYRIALDDVGKGTSSLSKITMADPDIIKLDKWFSHKLSKSKEKQNSIKRLMRFCGTDIQLVLEGLETREDLETARELGLTYGQGFFLGEPAALYQGSLKY